MDQETHHQWCTDFEKVIEGEGSCPQCQRLRLKYPPEGHLGYEVMEEWYRGMF
jgi:hypothetical protein